MKKLVLLMIVLALTSASVLHGQGDGWCMAGTLQPAAGAGTACGSSFSSHRRLTRREQAR